MRSSGFAVLLAVIVFVHPIGAQTVDAVRGKVVDQDGHAVENAQLVLTPGARRAITVDGGQFAIANVRAGTYVLTVRRVGYVSTAVNFAVGDSMAPLTITLASIPGQLDAVHIREKSGGIRYMGVVLDQNDLPVAGAEVVAIGINSNITTDSLGQFTVPKLARGTLMLRIRKMGYAAYFDSFRILAERADTIRMPRLAQSLAAVDIKERSGFGSDEMAYEELSQRTRWKSPTAGTISREELAQQGTVNLCEAIPSTPSGNRRVAITQADCVLKTFRVLLNGMECQMRKLTEFAADRVEIVEYYPPRAETVNQTPAPSLRRQNVPTPSNWQHGDNSSGTDVGLTLAEHNCPAEVFVIWLRHDLPPAPAGASTPQTVRPLTNPSHLQGQVVDSAGRPIRSAILYSDDPPRATLSDKNGYFRFAALPPGAMTLRVERGGFVGTQFELRLPPDSTVGIGVKLFAAAPIIESASMEIAVGADAGQPGQRVRVVSAEGEPIEYANVVVEGAMPRITDAKGEVTIGAGKHQTFAVSVSRIGFVRWFGKVDLPATALMTVTLPRTAQALATVTVKGEASATTMLAKTGFYDRWKMREKGALSADFIGPEEIESRHPDKISNMLRGLNGVCLAAQVSAGGGTSRGLYAYATHAGQVIGGGGCPACPMAIVIDGLQQIPPPAVDDLLDADDVAAIEVYARAGNTPIGMQVNDTKCGVIAFWTGARR